MYKKYLLSIDQLKRNKNRNKIPSCKFIVKKITSFSKTHNKKLMRIFQYPKFKYFVSRLAKITCEKKVQQQKAENIN